MFLINIYILNNIKIMTDRAIKLINMVLSHEGGYSSGNERQTKGDKGKETYCGISRVFNPRWDGWKIVDKYKPIKYNAIIKDSKLEASVRQYYYNAYYVPLKCEQFTSLLIAGHLFCHGVNAGIKTSAKLLQKAINKVYEVNITVDGIIGATTLKYANGNKMKSVATEFINQRNLYYKNITIKNPSQKKFLNGWYNRVKKTTKICSNSSINVLFTSLSNGDFLKKLLSFIYDLIQLFNKKG